MSVGTTIECTCPISFTAALCLWVNIYKIQCLSVGSGQLKTAEGQTPRNAEMHSSFAKKNHRCWVYGAVGICRNSSFSTISGLRWPQKTCTGSSSNQHWAKGVRNREHSNKYRGTSHLRSSNLLTCDWECCCDTMPMSIQSAYWKLKCRII